MKWVSTELLLVLVMPLLVTACGASAKADTVALPPLQGGTNASALVAAERGEIGRPVLVFFHAQWCHICEKVRPQIEQLAEVYDGELVVVRMDIDDPAARSAVERYRVTATPTFALLTAGGSSLAVIPGWPGRHGIERTIAQLLEMP